jgi:hypothetical protein
VKLGESREFQSQKGRDFHTCSHLSGLRVPGCRFRGLGSIPGTTRFSEKQWLWNRVHPAS